MMKVTVKEKFNIDKGIAVIVDGKEVDGVKVGDFILSQDGKKYKVKEVVPSTSANWNLSLIVDIV